MDRRSEGNETEALAVEPMPGADVAPAAPAPDAAPQADPVQLRAVTVKSGRIICDLVVPDERFRNTTPRITAFVTARYPDLAHHACVNGSGPSFGVVMEHTSIPHLLEHLIISEQTRASHGAAAKFAGTTEWTDEDAGEARVEVSFHDDLEALRALSEATRFLNIAVLTCLA